MKRKGFLSSSVSRSSSGCTFMGVCSLLLGTFCSSAAQVDIEWDGSFENGIGGWYGYYGVFDHPDAADGAHVAGIMTLADSLLNQPLFQWLPTIPGQTYTISFALRGGAGYVGEHGVPAPIKVGWSEPTTSWSDTIIMEVQNTSQTSWKYFQFDAVAISTSTQLTFLNLQNRNIPLLDDVHVWYLPASLPESGSTLLLFGSSVAASFVFARKEQRASC